MKEKYRFIRYRPEYKDQVLALREFGFGTGLPTASRFFAWKYEHNPYLNMPLVYLVLQADRVVGSGSFYGIQWEGGHPRQAFTALGVGDIVVYPAHQSRGLLRGLQRTALSDLAITDYPYLFALSARPAAHLRGLRIGWHAVGGYETVRRQGRAGVAETCMKRLKRLGGFGKSSRVAVQPQFDIFDRKRLRRRFRSEFRMSVEEAPRPQEMADLIRRIPYDGRLRHVRDEQYFGWRFLHPLRTYRFLFCGDTSLDGYLILQMSRNAKTQRAHIIDWEATTSAVREELLDMALFYMEDGRLTVWSATLADNDKNLLRNRGFVPEDDTGGIKRYERGLIVRPVREALLNEDWTFAGRHLLDMNNWDLRMAYSDEY